jgi:hypothetical protein
VLAFSDEALARLAVAATRVALPARSEWLQDIASRLDPPKLKPGARRTRAWRARAKAGRCLLKVETDEAAFAVVAVADGLLNPLQADDVGALNQAAAKVLAAYSGGDMSLRGPGDVDSIRTRLLREAR